MPDLDSLGKVGTVGGSRRLALRVVTLNAIRFDWLVRPELTVKPAQTAGHIEAVSPQARTADVQARWSTAIPSALVMKGVQLRAFTNNGT
jgi:hypothetical protein